MPAGKRRFANSSAFRLAPRLNTVLLNTVIGTSSHLASAAFKAAVSKRLPIVMLAATISRPITHSSHQHGEAITATLLTVLPAILLGGLDQPIARATS